MNRNILFIASLLHLINFSLLMSNSEPDIPTEKKKFESLFKKLRKIKNAMKNRDQRDQKQEVIESESEIGSESEEKIATPENQNLIEEEAVAPQLTQPSQSQEKSVTPTPITVHEMNKHKNANNNSQLIWCDKHQVTCVTLSFLASFSAIMVPTLIYKHYN
ncbi:MAG TPA: hypothetical protein VJ201_03570 [Candidatus Babeliales bacterium]|nr:hypothetical protein [Candidatus Babeliales bacterium]